MEIRDLVVRDLVTVGPADTLAQAAKLMSAKRVGSAIVLTDENPGILSERDVLRAVADGADPAVATVGDYMTWNAIAATSDWEGMQAARTMLANGLRHPVVTDGSATQDEHERFGHEAPPGLGLVDPVADVGALERPPLDSRQVDLPGQGAVVEEDGQRVGGVEVALAGGRGAAGPEGGGVAHQVRGT